jgi:hypothetical protein
VVGLNSRCYRSCEKWWQRPEEVAAELRLLAGRSRKECYYFGRSLLVMDCEDSTFSRRFRDIFAECACGSSGTENMPRADIRVTSVRSNPEVLAVSVVPSALDGIDFVRQLFPERGYVECPGPALGWRMLALPEAPKQPVLAFGPSAVLVSRSHPWQRMIALYAINNAFFLQPDVFVFHAASVAISGKGVLLFGGKGAGKTTLALCFASRGHAFLGDEWGVVSGSTGELLPLRRMVSIRPGLRPRALDEYLRKHRCDTEVLPDGTERVRARVGAIFPRASAKPAPLMHAFFLRRFAPRPAVEPYAPHGAQLPPVAPLLASVWNHSLGRRGLELLRTVGKARWWHLDVGGLPEETADLVEQTVKEDLWD